MLTKSKIALVLALTLGTASAAMAAASHEVAHQRTAVERPSRVPVPTYMHIQTQDNNESVGCPC